MKNFMNNLMSQNTRNTKILMNILIAMTVLLSYTIPEGNAWDIRLGTVEETKFASIDRLIVLESSRGKGIGTALLNKAREWALQKGMQGFTLETQDVNLLACRFYLKNGFDIGAVDTMLYSNSKYKDENAVFFYSKF
ncbi:GNAT family N-acetyltransferase [Paenibacillus polymyxa]|uniref:GNAT family N-acetyltransferase n=1 Tax=Paenibacillus polymyxa TaxID=1406 RepID=UPI0025B65384|nr:GNAT family N-acetyltransferase [Paenibacillus polymyxa]MDN4083132.1 GNAT family N-acetyltransferase [Paenibacillus polymyxa]MDN4107269.1 GNAT family N-acetyltransferase [Paenibacillus polymyxa]